MYDYIYFDLDNTLIRDNPRTGNSELVQVGQDDYLKLRKEYSTVPFILFTNRIRAEIKYPNVYTFDEVVGKDDMEKLILERMGKIPMEKYLNPKNLLIYLTGLFLFRTRQTPKVLYLFFRHTVKDERVIVKDDDKRVAFPFKF
jgi:hypothetical protein